MSHDGSNGNHGGKREGEVKMKPKIHPESGGNLPGKYFISPAELTTVTSRSGNHTYHFVAQALSLLGCEPRVSMKDECLTIYSSIRDK